MNLADFYNQVENKSLVTAETVGVYPVDREFSLPEITNITLDDDKLIFDMDSLQDNLRDYDYVKFICLGDTDLRDLQTSDFPSSLSVETQEFIFGIKRDDIVSEPKESFSRVSVPLKSFDGRDYKILIVFGYETIEEGIVFLLSVNPRRS